MIYFTHAPGSARYFNIDINEDGRPMREDVVCAARERVIIEVDITQT